MKKMLYAGIITATFAVVAPMSSAQAVETEFTAQPTISTVEQVQAKYPVPHDVTWTISGQAEDGSEIIESFSMTVTKQGDSTATCTITGISDVARTYRLNKSTCPGLRVYNQYTVTLWEVYADDISNADTETLRTKPPKAKRLKAKKKTANSVRIKFNRGVQIAGEYMYVDYKVARRNNSSKIVANGADYTGSNYVDITGLPANKKLKARVRFRSTAYGNSPWSTWKNFKTLAD